MTMIIPETNNANDHEENIILNESSTDGILDEESLSSSSTSSDEDNLIEEDNEEDNFMNTHVVFSNQDPTLNQTQDNINTNHGFFTTHTGDSPINILQDQKKLSVTGHVIFNQAGTCTTRKNHNITGTSRQKHLVQSLCATIPGQASPLLQPEASLFPRHFYIAANNDKCSILGARPLFLINSKRHIYGFSSTLSQARLHMTNPFSTTSTDPNLMCMYFDQLANMSLNNNHSRDLFQRGFVVDNKSACGLSTREK